MVNIKQYIDSGILETYVMGIATEEEAAELLRYKEAYPEIKNALQRLELDMELIAERMAIAPPPAIWSKISESIDERSISPSIKSLRLVPDKEESTEDFNTQKSRGYIEVESETTHMRVHKTWKWVFIAVFILSKLFLITAIYFYLENRQAQQQIQELKTQIKQQQIK